MFPSAVLELIQSSEHVQIVNDNHISPHVSFTENAPVVRVSRSPAKSTWGRRRRKSKSRPSPVANDTPRSRWESSPKQQEPSKNAVSLTPTPIRRISFANVPDNISNESLASPSPPTPRGRINVFNPDSFRSPTASTKIASPSLMMSPGESSIASSSSVSSTSSPLFNRWDSSPSSVVFSPASTKGKFGAASTTMMSLKDYAAQQATGMSAARRACLSLDKTFHEKLRREACSSMLLSPPKKPERRGSYDDVSETASLLDEALRITAEGDYDEDPFADTTASSIPAPPLSC